MATKKQVWVATSGAEFVSELGALVDDVKHALASNPSDWTLSNRVNDALASALEELAECHSKHVTRRPR
jgi:hypothetical protein